MDNFRPTNVSVRIEIYQERNPLIKALRSVKIFEVRWNYGKIDLRNQTFWSGILGLFCSGFRVPGIGLFR